jgi:hypothetical protein
MSKAQSRLLRRGIAVLLPLTPACGCSASATIREKVTAREGASVAADRRDGPWVPYSASLAREYRGWKTNSSSRCSVLPPTRGVTPIATCNLQSTIHNLQSAIK